MTLGERLRNARERAKLSQDDLAAKSGVPRSTISGIEALGKHPRMNTLLALAKVVDVSLDQLMDHRATVITIQETREDLEQGFAAVATVLETARNLSAAIREDAERRDEQYARLEEKVDRLSRQLGAVMDRLPLSEYPPFERTGLEPTQQTPQTPLSFDGSPGFDRAEAQ